MNHEREFKRLKKEFGELWEYLENYDAFIAGGAITSMFTNSEVNDFDVYFSSNSEMVEFLEELDGSYTIMSHTDKATLLVHSGSMIQLIHFDYFKSATEIFNKFDFTVCMGAYSFKDKCFVLHDDFLIHNSQRVLKFNPSTAFPYISMLRVQKYQSKGYSISKPEFSRVMLACAKRTVESYEDAMEQLGGMYGNNISNIISKENKETFSVDALIEDLGKLDVSDFDFEMPKTKELDSEELMLLLSNEKLVAYESNNQYARINKHGISEVSKSKINESEKYEVLKVETIFKSGYKLYKWVKRVGLDYVSFYNKDFKYKLGEIVNDNHNGVWVSVKDCADELMYANYDDAVLIELEVLEDTGFLGFNSGCVRATKLKVIDEVEFDKENDVSDLFDC